MRSPLNRPARLAIFASGRGSNLDAILNAYPVGHALAHVAVVISDNAEAGALAKAKAADIAAHHHPFPARKYDPDGSGRTAFESKVAEWLERHSIDLICLAGFMRILSAEFNEQWRGHILNIHPSLLPRFPGLHPQRQALAAGVNTSGCTVHFVDAGVDTGPVVLQRSVPVLPDDTEESLSQRILQAEHEVYPEAIERVLTGVATFEEVAR